MRLGRTSQSAGRRKLESGDLTPGPSAFAYRSQRSPEIRSAGRQSSAEKTGPTPGNLVAFWTQRFGLAILLIAVVASLINVLSLSDSAQVRLLDGASQTFLQPSAVYQQAADQALKQSIWNRNKITVDTSALSRSLLKQFPELNSVSVTVPLLAHRPIIYVQPAQPALTLTAGNGSFIISRNGKALLRAGKAAADVNLPTVDEQTNLQVSLNHQALSADTVAFIQTVVGQLAAKQYTVSGMTLPAGGAELDVRLSGQPYFIKFNLESDNPTGEAGTFLATIAQLHKQNITPSQYVDVRVDGRAYYK